MSETKKGLGDRLQGLLVTKSFSREEALKLEAILAEVDALEAALVDLESGGVAVTGAGAAGFIRRRMSEARR